MARLLSRRPAAAPAAAAAGLAVALREVSCRDPGGRPLLDGVSLGIEPGECLAVVGPNGAGKTTLLRLVCGARRPSAGRALLGGRDAADWPAADRARRVAVVSQGEAPDPRLSLGDYVALGRIPHEGRASAAADRAAVERAMARVGLAGLAGRRLGELSGGERQRGAIARALAQGADLLVLDEPTNHLDPRARADLLAGLRGLGITVVAALHDLALVDGFADRVAVLSGGRLVAHGPPAASLTPAVVDSVFAMHGFRVSGPVSGRDLLVFDLPPDPAREAAP